MDPVSEDRFEEFLKGAAADYNQPPETPREQIWARVQEGRRANRDGDRPTIRPAGRPPVRWLAWPAAIAALLLLGIAIGRLSVKSGNQGVGPEPAAVRPPSDLALTLAATQHLSRTEAFLTGFRREGSTEEAAARFSATAGDLLMNTRLLLDSPQLTDPQLRLLLEDLELILAQINQLAAEGKSGKPDLITDGLNQRGLLPRLRSAIPAGGGPGPVQEKS
jgi:hypothetical protein